MWDVRLFVRVRFRSLVWLELAVAVGYKLRLGFVVAEHILHRHSYR